MRVAIGGVETSHVLEGLCCRSRIVSTGIVGVTWQQGFNGVFTLSTQAGAAEHLRSISDPMDGPARLRNPIDQRSAAQMPSCASDAPLWLRRDDTACIELDVSGYALEYH